MSASEMTTQAKREYVEASWESVEGRWLPSMPYRFRVEMLYDSAMVWVDANKPFTPQEQSRVMDAAWDAAYAFTIERVWQIAERTNDIDHAILWQSKCWPGSDEWKAADRIIKREQSALQEMRRGMRKEGE